MSIKISNEIKSYWNSFLSENENLKYSSDYKIDAWSFGNTKEMADELGQLVLAGKKTATCSLLRAYRDHEEEIPRVGTYSVLCDGNEKPLCIIFLTDTWICNYNEVTEKHAYQEGEGDRSLDYWKKAHLDFFSNYEGFTADDQLICERFKMAFK